MSLITKIIGRLPVNLGAYDNKRSYSKKNRVTLYGCEFESKINSNTYAPASIVEGAVVVDTTHWKLISGVPENYFYHTELADKASASDLTSHTGNTNNPHSVTKSQVGLGNVGNFKAVSTEANQGLSSTEQGNARTNIGAGTYSKPGGGIPSSDLAQAVQNLLTAAGTALQSSDLTTLNNKVTALEAYFSSEADSDAIINKWNEIVAFLAGIAESQTLDGIINGINTQISGKAGKSTTLAGYGITDAYTKSETYSKTEVNGLVDTPHQEYVTVADFASLPASGSEDTIYRVSNYDGSQDQVSAGVYSEYAWDGTQYVFLCVKSAAGEVFDITEYNNNTKYADLAAALDSNNGGGVPQSLQKGGMSVKFVRSSDNKYVQYRLTNQTFSTSASDWQKQGAEVSVSQNTLSNHIDINVGGNTTVVPSLDDVSSVNQEINAITFASEQDGEVYFKFIAGNEYTIRNTGAKVVNFSTRVTRNGETVDGLYQIQPNQKKIFTASADANYLRFGAATSGSVELNTNIKNRITALEERIEEDEESNLLDLLTTLNTKKQFFVKLSGAGKNSTFKVTKGHTYIARSMSWNVGGTISIADEQEDILQIIGTLNPKSIISFTAEQSGYFRVGATSADIKIYIYEDTVTEKRFDLLEDAPLVVFNYKDGLQDETVDVNFSTDFVAQIEERFDNLILQYPSYISKTDAITGLGLSYPTYANLNGVAVEPYLATPSYTTKLYHLTDENNIYSELVTRRDKILIVAGVHGNERAAVYNAYLFAKHLCEATIEDYFKIRSKFDIYILPIANGYGVYHSIRQNANGVNINRNFPIEKWSKSGVAWDNDYTGETANGEFETQLITSLISTIQPKMVIDHHNYQFTSGNIFQFYTEVNEPRMLHLSHQSLVDICCNCIKSLPNYFGSSYLLLRNSTQDAPAKIASIDVGTLNRWAFEQEMVSATVEISNTINYLNGTPAPSGQGMNGDDVFSVGEYTLRNQVMRYGQYL